MKSDPEDLNLEKPLNRYVPQIYSMHISSTICNRFAETLVTSKVKNSSKTAEQAIFFVILPEKAFISKFEMEVDGNIYKAQITERENAENVYAEAVSHGQSVAQVYVSVRDSKKFAIPVNIEPEKEAIFRLTYEELLERKNGQYEMILNVHPGQLVEDLRVDVEINESRPLKFVKSPSLRTGNEINKDDPNLDPSAKIKFKNPTSVCVKFNPDQEQQKKFAELLGNETGFSGQFVVQYDVERDPTGGEILVRDGYFVHFFAPNDLEPLPKHVVFVMDHSGSMQGRKLKQVMRALRNIISELNPDDLFHILRFSDGVSVWNIIEDKTIKMYFDTCPNYENFDSELDKFNLPEAVKATEENKSKVKNIKQRKFEMGGTNIILGLVVALYLIKKSKNEKYQPMVVFLTDGLPNVHISSEDEIIKIITQLNSGANRAAIFSLSFGEDADKDFLKKLSAKNLGFSRHIYESSDAALQLENFYKTISSPSLRDVNFKYVDEVLEVTRIYFPNLFHGSEIVVAGKLGEVTDITLKINCLCMSGFVEFTAKKTLSEYSLERLWAYLTVKQLLADKEVAEDAEKLTKRALYLALRYSFVTSITSLVVVKSNEYLHYPNLDHNFKNYDPILGLSDRDDAIQQGGIIVYTSLQYMHTSRSIFRVIGRIWENIFEYNKFKLADIKTEISKDSNLKSCDVELIIEWIKTQHQLPTLNKLRVILFLQSCNYDVELAKITIDKFFTIRTICNPLFKCERPFKDSFDSGFKTALITFLPKKTPENHEIIFIKFLKSINEKTIFIILLKYFDMICMMHLHQEGTANGHIIVLDMENLEADTLNHFDMNYLTVFLYYIQEVIPLRVKGVHCFNLVPFMDDILNLIKPFIKKENFQKIHLHKTFDDLLSYVPKKCLPKDYGGSVDSVCKLQRKMSDRVSKSEDIFCWLVWAVSYESRRCGECPVPYEILDIFDEFCDGDQEDPY